MIDRDGRCVKKGNSVSVEVLSGELVLHHYKGTWPKLGERVYIAEGAQIIGDVEIGDHSSVWFNSVIRGDVYYVRIGQHTNIQDGCVGHVQKDQCALILKDYVTV